MFASIHAHANGFDVAFATSRSITIVIRNAEAAYAFDLLFLFDPSLLFVDSTTFTWAITSWGKKKKIRFATDSSVDIVQRLVHLILPEDDTLYCSETISNNEGWESWMIAPQGFLGRNV